MFDEMLIQCVIGMTLATAFFVVAALEYIAIKAKAMREEEKAEHRGSEFGVDPRLTEQQQHDVSFQLLVHNYLNQPK